MSDKWKIRCDDNHAGHYFVDYMRKIPNEICQIDAATGEQETCASVLSRSQRLAQCFRQLGLVPGDPIIVGGKNHLDLTIPFYAGMMSGQPVAGVDPALKSTELKHLFKIVQPKIAFCEYAMFDEYKQALQDLSLGTKIVTFGGGELSLTKLLDTQHHEDELEVATFNTDEVYCWLASTSGSTGRPKVVALTHPHVLQMLDLFRLPTPQKGVRKTALNLSTLNWISGCYNSLAMPMTHIMVKTSAPITTEHIIYIINKYRPAGTVCTPTLLTPIMHHETYCDLTCFDHLTVGGSKVHKEFLKTLRSRLHKDAVILQGYGLSETGGAVLHSTTEQPFGNVGRVDPKFQAKLISPETRKEILEPNVVGELYAKGPRMACYYNDAKETEDAFTDDGYFKTGDLFYKDENGYFFFVERLKMLLKYKNYPVIPPEIEEVILTHEGVQDVCVTGVPHPDDGEHVVACVVRQPGVKVTAQEIKDLVAKHLSPSKHLHGGVVFLDALPTTSVGKIARLEVKKLARTAHKE